MQHTQGRKTLFYSLTGIIILVILTVLSLTLGAADISFEDALLILAKQIPTNPLAIDISHLPKMSVAIILKLRLPRILLSVFVGSLLAGAGTVYQSVFRNPMADPFILGISSGAALGAALAMIFGLNLANFGLSSITIAAFIGASLTTFVVYTIATRGRDTSILSLILTGIAISYLLSAMLSLLITFNREELERIVFWIYGSFAVSTWAEVKIILPIFIVTTLLFLSKTRMLNLMSLGAESATALGVDVRRQRFILLTIASIATAASVSVSGIIGFVGLVIPHLVRLISGSNNNSLLPFSMLLGAIFLLICDALARTLLAPMEIPIGIISAILGAPFFIYLILNNRRRAG